VRAVEASYAKVEDPRPDGRTIVARNRDAESADPDKVLGAQLYRRGGPAIDRGSRVFAAV
jgi:hypothetical protein